MSKPNKQSKNAAFTLIELLVVSTIIIVLLSIGIISYRNASLKSRNNKRKADLDTMRQALMLYKGDYGNFPTGSFSLVRTQLIADDYLPDDVQLEDPRHPTHSYDYVDIGSCGSGACDFELRADIEQIGGGTTTYTVSSP